jgi:hypothetical protein
MVKPNNLAVAAACRTGMFKCLLVAVSLGISSSATAQTAVDPLERDLSKTLADAFSKGKFRDISGREREGMPPENCIVIDGNHKLAEHPVIKPYRDAFEGHGSVVLECQYLYSMKNAPKRSTGYAIVANASAAQIARWVVGACRRATLDNAPVSCTKRLIDWMAGQNGFQFPVAGFVNEGPGNCVKGRESRGQNGLIAFRDGITIQPVTQAKIKTDYCRIDGPSVAMQQSLVLDDAPGQVFNIGRIAGTDRRFEIPPNWPPGVTRSELLRSVPIAGESEVPWQRIVREGYLSALGTDRYELLELHAKGRSQRQRNQ